MKFVRCCCGNSAKDAEVRRRIHFCQNNKDNLNVFCKLITIGSDQQSKCKLGKADSVTGHLHGMIVGPTGWSDWSVRPIG